MLEDYIIAEHADCELLCGVIDTHIDALAFGLLGQLIGCLANLMELLVLFPVQVVPIELRCSFVNETDDGIIAS